MKIRLLPLIILLALHGGVSQVSAHGHERLLAKPSQSGSSLADFQALTLNEIRTLQVKLTYVGTQNKPIPTVAFGSFFYPLDMEKFKPFRRPGIFYGNDELAVILNFTATPEELKRVINSLATFGPVARGSQGDYLSLLLYYPADNGPMSFEAILDYPNAKLLFPKIKTAIGVNNKMALQVLTQQQQILF